MTDPDEKRGHLIIVTKIGDGPHDFSFACQDCGTQISTTVPGPAMITPEQAESLATILDQNVDSDYLIDMKDVRKWLQMAGFTIDERMSREHR